MVKQINILFMIGVWAWIASGCDQKPAPKAPPPTPLVVVSKPVVQAQTAKAVPAVKPPEKTTAATSGQPAAESAAKPLQGAVASPSPQGETPHKTPVPAPVPTGEKSPPTPEPSAEKSVQTPEPPAEKATPMPEPNKKNPGATPELQDKQGGVTEERIKKEMVAAEKKYDPKGRTDPFRPLVAEQEAASAAQEGEKEAPERPKRMLTPLEKMDLSQIKLVAVVEAGTRTIAMVEEASGKGYEVRMGTYMGRNGGQVTQIGHDRIVVKEYVKDFRGKRLERLQEIKANKNEE